MNELQNVNQNNNISKAKTPFAKFIDRLQRWHNITFDAETLKEMDMTFDRKFEVEDFHYCEKILMNDDQKKYRISAADLYKLCRESKLKRIKSEREEEDKKNRSMPVNKEGVKKVKKYLDKIKLSLKGFK